MRLMKRLGERRATFMRRSTKDSMTGVALNRLTLARLLIYFSSTGFAPITAQYVRKGFYRDASLGMA